MCAKMVADYGYESECGELATLRTRDGAIFTLVGEHGAPVSVSILSLSFVDVAKHAQRVAEAISPAESRDFAAIATSKAAKATDWEGNSLIKTGTLAGGEVKVMLGIATGGGAVEFIPPGANGHLDWEPDSY